MPVYPQNSITSTSNSTTTPLASGATFTGEWEQVNQPQVMVVCKTDNTGTLFFDFSPDGVNADSTFPVSGFEVASGINEFHTAVKGPRYFRVRLVNDTGAQSLLRLYTYYGSDFVPSSAPLNQTSSLDQDAIFTRSTVPQDEIRIGRRAGVEGFTKFGYRDGLTASAGEQVVWTDSSNSLTVLTAASTYTITYDGTSGGSTDGAGSNGALTLAITHINSDGNPETFVHTLGTDGSDVTTASGFGINRVAVASSGSDNSNASDITVTATTGGSVQAHVRAGNSVTEQAILHVGNNHDAVAKWLWILVNKPGGGAATKATVRAYVFNRLIETQFLVFRALIDTSNKPEIDITDPVGFNLSPGDTIYFVVDSNQDSSEIDLRFSANIYQRT